MKTKAIYWWLCAYLCAGFLNSAVADSRTADSLFANKQYKDACIEYEKEIFLSRNDSIQNFYLLKKAVCQKLLGTFNSEERTLARINVSKCTDSVTCVVYYERALCNYMLANFTKANDLLERAFSLPVSTAEYDACLLLHGFVLNELYKYEAAKNKFTAYYKTGRNSESLKAVSFIDSIYATKNIPHLKSLKKARRMSFFLPGAGLFYAKKPGRAITNITLLLGSATFTGYNIFIGNYITAAIAGVYFMKYFYTGGINQLNDEIPRYNYRKTRTFNDSVKHRLTALK
ncbi:MAG TPA: hypothetical protein VNY73_01680 [Bacteroidia bacterium]|nr:hypothetical protein [Bacteroidia bacterium]